MRAARFDWRLKEGIAGPGNLIVLLAVLLSFPLILRATGALAISSIDPQDPRHTPALLRFCFVVAAFLWVCFAIALFGIRIRGTSSFQDVIGRTWNNWHAVMRDVGAVLLTLMAMLAVGNLSNTFLAPFQHDAAAIRAMVAYNTTEALAFLILALTAGFVEEFVFRGYLQRQCQAVFGNTVLASALQVALFVQGHFYQGWIRLIPVLLIGALLTGVALWRKSLIPGMIAHGLGDSLVALSYLVRQL
jgi:membrane protease YdiL (CAAX protease family)